MNKIITDNLDALVDLCKKHRVKTLYLFGSANTDLFNDQSDLDFLISYQEDIPLNEYADNFFDLIENLERLFGRQIDLVNEKTLSNPYFIQGVEQTKRLIYAA